MSATFSVHGSGRRTRSVELPIDEDRSNVESGSSFDIYAYTVTEERLSNFRNETTNQTFLHFSPSFKAIRLPYYVVFSWSEDDGEKYAYVRSEDCHPLWLELESFIRDERFPTVPAVEEASVSSNRRFNRSRFFFPSSRFSRSPGFTIISLPPSIPVPIQLSNARESDAATTTDRHVEDVDDGVEIVEEEDDTSDDATTVSPVVDDGGEIEEEEDVSSEDLCKVCYARRKTHIAVPCGHFAFCRSCSVKLPFSCAVCRSPCHLYCKVINVE